MQYQIHPWAKTLLALAATGLMIDLSNAADIEANIPADTAQANLQHGAAKGLRTGDDFDYVEFYGQINKGYLGV